MRINDAAIGGLLLALALAVFVHAGSFPPTPGQPYGPSLFPRIIALGLGGAGLLLIVGGLRARRDGGVWVDLDAWARSGRGWANVLAVVLALVAYILLSGLLGFLLTGFVVLASLLLWLRGPRRLPSALAVSAAAVVVIHLIFVRLLAVPLPRGALETLIG